MNIIGIIAEYNPFHNGHAYHINKIKEKYPNSIIVLVLNGYFTQRGTISVLKKEDKVKIALKHNIDVVVELPFIYGTQSSDIFAFYSVKLLNEFKIDHLIFGSESNDLDLLNHEYYEQKFEGFFGTDYRAAHDRTLETGRVRDPYKEVK